jgi:hypothetical protein
LLGAGVVIALLAVMGFIYFLGDARIRALAIAVSYSTGSDDIAVSFAL